MISVLKRTYITQMPDKAGAFLRASRIIAEAGGNITRISYNKAVDLHMLFIEVSAEAGQLDLISDRLREIGYIRNDAAPGQTILLEFRLPNTPSAALPVLELIESCHFNITYISAQETEEAYQNLKIGLYISDPKQTKAFLDAAAKCCELKILNYDKSQKILDNTVFYLSFANQVSSALHLGRDATDALIADSNRIMQILDERNEAPYKTFSYIGKFAEMLHSFEGSAFCAKLHRRSLKNSFTLHMIEPPCGSNTYILEKNEHLLFIDCGFACYKAEMLDILHGLFPDFDAMEKSIVLTHPDIDHCGLLALFDRVYVSEDGRLNFAFENNSLPDFREQNKLHAPYCRISKLLSKYTPPDMDTLRLIERTREKEDAPISPLGSLNFQGLTLDIFEGNGGHAKGEIVLVDETNRLVYSGDIVVNIRGFSKEQAAFNALAPYLMTSVNLDSALAAEERLYLQSKFSPEAYTYCCGHGAIMESAT
ncbi:MAG: MBL fold metallo-hydrolase [Hominenteromicrobium sp.]